MHTLCVLYDAEVVHAAKFTASRFTVASSACGETANTMPILESMMICWQDWTTADLLLLLMLLLLLLRTFSCGFHQVCEVVHK
jgi:hypothetical protein